MEKIKKPRKSKKIKIADIKIPVVEEIKIRQYAEPKKIGERERRVTKEQLAQMPEESIKKIEEVIGAKIRGHMDHAVEEVNKLLKIYGLRAKMQFLIEEIK